MMYIPSENQVFIYIFLSFWWLSTGIPAERRGSVEVVGPVATAWVPCGGSAEGQL